MHSDTRNEMQLRVLSGLHRYPELLKSTPQYLTGDEPWATIRRALEAYHADKVGGHELLMGMLNKYGDDHFLELVRVLKNALAVPCKRWAETQIRVFSRMIQQDYEREQGRAA